MSSLPRSSKPQTQKVSSSVSHLRCAKLWDPVWKALLTAKLYEYYPSEGVGFGAGSPL
jgi:hypothetical protein